MSTSRFAHRRRQLGAALAGLCIAAGSVGGVALADPGNSNSGHSVSVEASVMVQFGMTPISARQAAARLNSTIDAAARTMAQSAARAIRSSRPVRTTAAATKAFADEVDAALTEFAMQSMAGLDAAGASTEGLVTGTMAALGEVAQTLPGIVAFDAGAEFSVVSGADGTSVSASLNPQVDTAVRQTISDSVRALRPVLPLSRATLQAVGSGVRQVVDASIVATNRILRATVNFVAAAADVTANTLKAARTVAESAVATTKAVVAAVDATLDNLSDVNITAQVDASLKVSAN